MIGAVQAQELQLAVVDAIEAAAVGHRQQLRHWQVAGLVLLGEPASADLVHQLERAEFPAIAELHARVDLDQRVGDLADQVGRVGEGGRQHAPGELGALVLARQQSFEAGLPVCQSGVEAGEADRLRRAVFAGLKVDRLLAARAALS